MEFIFKGMVPFNCLWLNFIGLIFPSRMMIESSQICMEDMTGTLKVLLQGYDFSF